MALEKGGNEINTPKIETPGAEKDTKPEVMKQSTRQCENQNHGLSIIKNNDDFCAVAWVRRAGACTTGVKPYSRTKTQVWKNGTSRPASVFAQHLI